MPKRTAYEELKVILERNPDDRAMRVDRVVIERALWEMDMVAGQLHRHETKAAARSMPTDDVPSVAASVG